MSITPKRIHEFETATPAELVEGSFAVEIETFNGIKWINRRVFLKSGTIAPESGAVLLESGDFLLLEDGEKLLKESEPSAPLLVSYVPPIEEVAADATLDTIKYYRITGGTNFTIEDASTLFSASVPFMMMIKNVSGGTINIIRSGSNVFKLTTGDESTFQMANAESATLVCGSSNEWDVN